MHVPFATYMYGSLICSWIGNFKLVPWYIALPPPTYICIHVAYNQLT